jgi:hypothetical protein
MRNARRSGVALAGYRSSLFQASEPFRICFRRWIRAQVAGKIDRCPFPDPSQH